eukprot:NODE_280_length_11906_cov_0.405268.p1 type:complete len:593 gc:universal NODE_280_length_11906_cov_0.405268:2886-4664(+)
MLFLLGIVIASLVSIRTSNVYKRDFDQSSDIVLEFQWNGTYLVFRLAEIPATVYVDSEVILATLFKGNTDEGIPGVFTYSNSTWQGSFKVNDNVYHAFPSSHPRALEKRENEHYITGAEDHDFVCRTNTNITVSESKNLKKRSEVSCPTARQILPVCIAVDCNYYKLFQGQSTANVLQELGLASLILEENINVGLGVIKVDIRTTCGNGADNAVWNNECSADVQDRLNKFTAWSGTQKEKCGIWHLITQCSYGPTLGIAWINSACRNEVISQNSMIFGNAGLSSVSTDGYKVVAHEIMHNLGAVHDCTSSQCTGVSECGNNQCNCCPCEGCDCKASYLMNPSLTLNTKISPCTKTDVCGNLPFLSSCLLEDKSELKTLGFCGNGIVEDNEECDPGISENECCSASCKLKPNATCSDSNHGCCTNCKVSTNNKICRASKNECDVQEICNNVSRDCPVNRFLNNGQACSNGRCSNGMCTNSDDQCALKGHRLGYKNSCTNGCKMLCSDSLGQCVDTNSNFLPGTSCKLNGKCNEEGICAFDNNSDAIISWVSENATLICVLSTVFVVILIYIALRFRKSRKDRDMPSTPAILSR